LQPVDPRIFRIAGDNRGVDRANGYSRDPVGMEAVLAQRFVDAGLKGAERAAAL
jgi:hypothetical protein